MAFKIIRMGTDIVEPTTPNTGINQNPQQTAAPPVEDLPIIDKEPIPVEPEEDEEDEGAAKPPTEAGWFDTLHDVVKGGKEIATNFFKSDEQAPQNETWPQTIGRNVVNAGTQAIKTGLGGVGSLADTVLQGTKALPSSMTQDLYLPERLPIPTMEDIGKIIDPFVEEHFGKGYLIPHNVIEKGLHMVAQDLPTYALAGGFNQIGKFGKLLKSSIAGATGQMIGQSIPLGSAEPFRPLVEVTGDILGRGVHGVRSELLGTVKGMGKTGVETKITRFRDRVNKAAKETYAVADKEFKPIEHKILNSVEGRAKFDHAIEMFDKAAPTTVKAVRPDMYKFDRLYTNKGIRLKDALEIKQNAGSKMANYHPETPEYKLYKTIFSAAAEVVDYGEKQFPKWGIPHAKADDLWTGLKAGKNLKKLAEDKDFVDQIMHVNPFVKSILFGGSLAGLGPKRAIEAAGIAAAVWPIQAATRRLTDTVRMASASPEIKKILKEIAIDAAFNNKAAVINSINKLDKAAPDVDYGEEILQGKNPRLKIVKLGTGV